MNYDNKNRKGKGKGELQGSDQIQYIALVAYYIVSHYFDFGRYDKFENHNFILFKNLKFYFVTSLRSIVQNRSRLKKTILFYI